MQHEPICEKVREYNGVKNRPANVRVFRVDPCIAVIKSAKFPDRTFIYGWWGGAGGRLQLQTKRGKVVWLGEWKGYLLSSEVKA